MANQERINLTQGRVDGFYCPDGRAQAFLWDAEVRGLAVRATPAGIRNPKGGRAYIFQGYLNGATPRVTIGDIKIWTLEKARSEARRLQTLIDQGIDPRQEKADRRAREQAERESAERQQITVDTAWNDYVASSQGNWGEHVRRDVLFMQQPGGERRSSKGMRKGDSEFTKTGLIYPLFKYRLVDVSADLLKEWMDDCNKRGRTNASNAFKRFRAFWNWCIDNSKYSDLVDEKAFRSRELRSKVQKNLAKSDCLQREQLADWFKNVIALENPYISAFLQVALITGGRPEEVECIKWTDVDFRWNTITIRDKVETFRIIPLTPYVRSLLKNLEVLNNTPPPPDRILEGKRIKNDLENWKPSEWVFSSKLSKSGHIEDPRAAHEKVLKTAGLPTITRHGLRRSFGTLSEWVECPVGIVAQIQGHKPSAIAEKHYRVRPIDLLRLWHTKIEAWIIEQARISFDADTSRFGVANQPGESGELSNLSNDEQQLVSIIRQLSEEAKEEVRVLMHRMLANGRGWRVMTAA